MPRTGLTASNPSPRRTRAKRWSAWLGVFFALAVFARAQTVHWENADGGDPAALQLVFQDCSPNGDPKLPQVDGVTFTLEGTSTQATLNGFSVMRYTILSYRVRSTKGGALQIPTFDVATDKGTKRVPAFRGGTMRTATDFNITSRLEPGGPTVWAGEVFPLTYTLDASRRSFNQASPTLDWNPAPLIVEEWSKFETNEVTAGGEPRFNFVTRTRAYIKSPGAVALNPASQLVNLQTGNMGFGLFQAPRIEQVTVESTHPTILVRPLPDGAPAGFAGAVGQFKLTSKVVPTTAAPGEPVTWTLELTGTGNWPEIAGLPQREVAKDFDVVQPKAKRTNAEGKLFEATLTEDVVLVPTKTGTYTLGPVTFAYFEPHSGTYKTIETPSTTVTINPPASPANAATPTAAANPPGESLDQGRLAELKAKAPGTPSGLPRDPRAGEATAWAPLGRRGLELLLIAPGGLLLLWWGALALRRAKQTDPLRPRREAGQRLASTLQALKGASDPAQRATQLLRWQHDAAILFHIRHAAPSADVFAASTVLRKDLPPVRGALIPDAAWQPLWREAEAALYREGGALPADWIERAEAALAKQKLPEFSPLRLFLPRNLLPFVAALALAVIVSGGRAGATEKAPLPPMEAGQAYRSGDFAAAEAAWAGRVEKQPRDAVARYNLSLALAQQDRWGEAAAQASAAFVQQPDDAAIRWQLALTCEKAGYVPEPLAHFLPAGPAQAVAGLASVGTWERIAVGASILLAGALALALPEMYGRRSRGRRWTALALAGVALLLGAGAAVSVYAYGPAAHRSAVVVWRAGVLRSIPTEADTTQKTTTLPAGSVAVVNKTLLGWVRLAFDNGQTGWVRREEVIGLWE